MSGDQDTGCSLVLGKRSIGQGCGSKWELSFLLLQLKGQTLVP